MSDDVETIRDEVLDLLDEVLDMLDHGSDTDYADTKYAIIAKIKQWQRRGRDPATCGHDWRLAFREVPDIRNQAPRPHSITVGFYHRCVLCDDTRADPCENTVEEAAANRAARIKDLPGQTSLLDLAGVMNQMDVPNGWERVGNGIQTKEQE